MNTFRNAFALAVILLAHANVACVAESNAPPDEPAAAAEDNPAAVESPAADDKGGDLHTDMINGGAGGGLANVCPFPQQVCPVRFGYVCGFDCGFTH